MASYRFSGILLFFLVTDLSGWRGTAEANYDDDDEDPMLGDAAAATIDDEDDSDFEETLGLRRTAAAAAAAAAAAGSGAGGGGEGGGGGSTGPQPTFDTSAPNNVSGLTNEPIYLHCIVHNLGNNSVSWIRQRDLHILTVGSYTYTTDQRYEVLHSAASNDWILKIKYAQLRDSGLYECQLSTKPPSIYTVKLNIFAPRAEIIGAPDLHVDKGSTINLTCTVVHSPEPPAYIFWRHNGKVIDYDSPRGGITVVMERGSVTRGYLLMQHASPEDSGNYTCAPSNTAPTAIRVHVLQGTRGRGIQGEKPAAMQTTGTASALGTAPGEAQGLLLLVALLLVLPHLFLLQKYPLNDPTAPLVDASPPRRSPPITSRPSLSSDHLPSQNDLCLQRLRFHSRQQRLIHQLQKHLPLQQQVQASTRPSRLQEQTQCGLRD